MLILKCFKTSSDLCFSKIEIFPYLEFFNEIRSINDFFCIIHDRTLSFLGIRDWCRLLMYSSELFPIQLQTQNLSRLCLPIVSGMFIYSYIICVFMIYLLIFIVHFLIFEISSKSIICLVYKLNSFVIRSTGFIV